MRLRILIVLGLFVLAVTSSMYAADETREVKLEDLKLNVPASWKQQQPSNNLRLGQFQIPAVEGDKEPAELTVFNFGAGGGVNSNLQRWIDQFQPDERKSKLTQGKSAMGDYVLADISGTYKKPIGPPIQGKTEPMPNARMLGVIISMDKKGLYFLKLTGPDKTVAAAKAAVRIAIGAKDAEEKPFELEK